MSLILSSAYCYMVGTWDCMSCPYSYASDNSRRMRKGNSFACVQFIRFECNVLAFVAGCTCSFLLGMYFL